MEQKHLVLIDAYSLLFRSFYGTRLLTTSDGKPTNALYGFLGMIYNILENRKPDAIVVAFDAPGKTFRHTEYSNYKGTRKDTPEELKSQLPLARKLIDAIGIPSYEVTGYEADDIIGTLSLIAEKHQYKTTIVTGDLDNLQLIDSKVSVMTTKQGVTDVVIYDEAKVKERYGFGPEHITDYKALVGDTSDNIPGVPGIGDKTASKLIHQYGSIENIIDQIQNLEPKYRKKIEPNLNQLKISKWLATIDRSVPLDYNFETYQLDQNQLKKATQFFLEMEFKTHLQRFSKIIQPYLKEELLQSFSLDENTARQIEIKHLQEIKTADQAFSWIEQRPFAMLFTQEKAQPSLLEETALDGYLAIENEVVKLPESEALKILKQLSHQAILYDSKPLLKKARLEHSLPHFDISLAAYVINPDRTHFELDELIQSFLEQEQLLNLEQKVASLYLLKNILSEKLKKDELEKVYYDIELALIPTLIQMELHGIKISANLLNEFSKSLEIKIESTAKTIYEMAGEEFLIGSPKQLGTILFEKMGISPSKKSKTGYATGAEILQVLATEHPICTEIMNWRELTKLKSTYADALPKLIQQDGRIHTTYNQKVAATGRLSSIDPNLQNIPIRSELGREIRKAFICDKGYQFASFDYSQIELRILAHYCKDEVLIEGFRKNEDIHSLTATLIFGVELQQVTKEQRRLAKVLNFAVLYGVTDYGLAAQLGGSFSIAETKQLIQEYYERFPGIKSYLDSTLADAKSRGYTTTLAGRRRYFSTLHISNHHQRAYAQRQAINAPLQGSSADMIKLAMVKVSELLHSTKSKLLLQVHDELLIELSNGEEALIPKIQKAMETALPIDVPIVVDIKLGQNWDEMKELA